MGAWTRRTRHIKKRLGLGLFVLLALAVGGGVYSFYDKPRFFALYGNVDIRDVDLSFRVFGRIQKMYYEEGRPVKAHELLATLERTPFEKEVVLEEAARRQARASLDVADKKFNRLQRLVKTGAVSQSAYDEAKAEDQTARALLTTAQARLDLAKTRLADTEIRAPNDGILLSRLREEGAVVAAGVPIYTLALESPVWVRTYVEEPRLGRVYPSQKALVMTDSGDTYEGHVGFISPQAEFTPKSVETTQLRTDLVYRLRVIVDRPDKGLRQGMPVTVRLLTP